MQDEFPNDDLVENNDTTVVAGALGTDGASSPCEDSPQENAQPGDKQTHVEADKDDQNLSGKESSAEAGTGQDENLVGQVLNDSSARNVNGVGGRRNKIKNKLSEHYHF